MRQAEAVLPRMHSSLRERLELAWQRWELWLPERVVMFGKAASAKWLRRKPLAPQALDLLPEFGRSKDLPCKGKERENGA